MSEFAFLLLGFFVGAVGTLVGAGGGFLLSPVFLFMYPDLSASRLTAMSLLAVAANSGSGSIGYAFRRQVHWPSMALYTVAAIPGVYLGVGLAGMLDRGAYETLFGFFLFAMSIFVFVRSRRKVPTVEHHKYWNKKNAVIGACVSFFVGILSSLLGIGGGIVHVPLLSEGLGYPLHLAAGTSHAILALTSIYAVFEHYQAGDLTPFNPLLIYLCVGLVLGAQAGAHYSKRVKAGWILKVLSLALFLVGLRLLLRNFA